MRALVLLVLGLSWWAASAVALEARLPLESRLAPAPDGRDEWRTGSTVEIVYYSICTGWVWVWSGVPPDATYGVFYPDPSAGEDRILRTHFFFRTGAPAGYGYTCLAQVLSHFEPGCPEGSLGYQFFLPADGWNTITWNGTAGIPVDDCWVLVDHSKTPGDPTTIVTEKGEPGGPHPGGCGTCYAPSRARHSFQLGMAPEIVCPGLPWLDESLCDLELLWKSEFALGTTALEQTSWGRVKGLYR
jgi:hypothetical protein